MKITINETQKEFILKAIWNISTLYDFENTTQTEFKECYNISKKDLIEQTNKLSEDLR